MNSAFQYVKGLSISKKKLKTLLDIDLLYLSNNIYCEKLYEPATSTEKASVTVFSTLCSMKLSTFL